MTPSFRYVVLSLFLFLFTLGSNLKGKASRKLRCEKSKQVTEQYPLSFVAVERAFFLVARR
ncbi:hypothetical protein COLO4_28354 [Corchorus olitorius]|uniref:Uncharacterized protein n=1 Tax=Corchorus olitorius TaxID=93759 RepID=A0A1R3HLJ7_9ROSI|nr:hypothetical protein COLO4_28354 [Corchorus olitorius]